MREERKSRLRRYYKAEPPTFAFCLTGTVTGTEAPFNWCRSLLQIVHLVEQGCKCEGGVVVVFSVNDSWFFSQPKWWRGRARPGKARQGFRPFGQKSRVARDQAAYCISTEDISNPPFYLHMCEMAIRYMSSDLYLAIISDYLHIILHLMYHYTIGQKEMAVTDIQSAMHRESPKSRRPRKTGGVKQPSREPGSISQLWFPIVFLAIGYGHGDRYSSRTSPFPQKYITLVTLSCPACTVTIGLQTAITWPCEPEERDLILCVNLCI
jgi:hypothetical protein